VAGEENSEEHMSIKKKAKTSVSTLDAISELFNKLTDAVCDPISELATLAMDPTTPLSDRITIFKELAQYTAPKRRAVDISSGNNDAFTIKIVKYSKDTVGQVRKMLTPEALKEIDDISDMTGTG
jgi:hypothetical protein